MIFLLFFVLVSLAFPLAVEVSKRGSDNLVVRSGRDFGVLVTYVTRRAAAVYSPRFARALKPIENLLGAAWDSLSSVLKGLVAIVALVAALIVILWAISWLLVLAIGFARWLLG